jgi:ribosomal protein S18 acetylase RimI-like enzyme
MDYPLPALEITLEDDPPARDLQRVLSGLLAFNRPLEPESRYTLYALFARDAAGAVRAGLSGAFYFNAFFIEHLWVDAPLRRQGIGRALLARAEADARADGRDLVHLEGMHFQSPAFFAAQGYETYALLGGYPDGAVRLHFRRTLPAQRASLSQRANRAANDAELTARGLRLEATTTPNADDLQSVRAGLHRWNAQAYRLDEPRPLNAFLRAPDGQVWGGLKAITCWDACFVDLFWVDVGLRHRGFGSALMREAEQEALRRGCTFVHLDTFNFQARGFYEKLGFASYGTLLGFVEGAERYHMVKRLRVLVHAAGAVQA